MKFELEIVRFDAVDVITTSAEKECIKLVPTQVL